VILLICTYSSIVIMIFYIEFDISIKQLLSIGKVFSHVLVDLGADYMKVFFCAETVKNWQYFYNNYFVLPDNWR